MRRVLFCTVLLLSLPASATISQVQSKATWAATGANCQVTFNSNPTALNMVAVWTSWTTSGKNNVSVISVKDSLANGKGTPPTFPNAVGPTLQSASNTAAQIFYATISTGGGTDTVTVAFSSAPSSSNCVIVEYSGLDQNYPLDSVSAAYSYTPGSLLDSGTAAPANSNLLIFGGGNWDAASLTAGQNFATIQASGGSITEQEIVSGNNTLQRATAIPNPTPGTTGNWLMQMAVFRDGRVAHP